MHQPIHPLCELFEQLGLPSDGQAIARFLDIHTPLAGPLDLHDAAFWTPAQAEFLRESLRQDADWSGVVDNLSKALRTPA